MNKVNITGVKGVYLENEKYRARVKFEGKLLCLGVYNTLEEAQHARVKKVNDIFGEFVHASEKILAV